MNASSLQLHHAVSRFRGAYQRATARLLFRRSFWVKPERQIISFTFDDFPLSALSVGGAILNRFGLAGTYYASLGLEGRHELGCHTFAHCDSWDTPTSVFEHSINANRLALEDLIPGCEFHTFSYPIGPPSPVTKSKVGRLFSCSRGGGQTLNVGLSDLNYLSAYFLEKSRGDFKAVTELIDRNRRVRGWLIFATHDISADPTQFGCTPDFFEDVVRYAVDSGARILPMTRALQALRQCG